MLPREHSTFSGTSKHAWFHSITTLKHGLICFAFSALACITCTTLVAKESDTGTETENQAAINLPVDTSEMKSLTLQEAISLVELKNTALRELSPYRRSKALSLYEKIATPFSTFKPHQTRQSPLLDNGFILNLAGLNTLPTAVARALANLEGGIIILDGLTEIDIKTAQLLKEFHCELLQLNGLIKLDPATAETLARFQGDTLMLSGLKTLDASTTEALAKFRGDSLFLNGLQTLDTRTAASLANFQGYHRKVWRYAASQWL